MTSRMTISPSSGLIGSTLECPGMAEWNVPIASTLSTIRAQVEVNKNLLSATILQPTAYRTRATNMDRRVACLWRSCRIHIRDRYE